MVKGYEQMVTYRVTGSHVAWGDSPAERYEIECSFTMLQVDESELLEMVLRGDPCDSIEAVLDGQVVRITSASDYSHVTVALGGANSPAEAEVHHLSIEPLPPGS